MQNRNVSLAACVWFAAWMAAYGQGTGVLFLDPGAQSAGSRLVAYNNVANNLNQVLDKQGPSGAFQVIAKPDGTKFYVLGTGVAGGLQAIDSGFANFHLVN